MTAVAGSHARAAGPRYRSDSMELAAHPGAVGPARLRARLDLRDWHLDDLSADVEQVVGELVSNAVTATRDAGLDAGITLTLTWSSDGIVVAVRDEVPSPPVPASPDTDSEHGRGLLIVEALAAWTECRPAPVGHGTGKLVRACIALPQPQSR